MENKEKIFESLVRENHARLVRVSRTFASPDNPYEDIYQEILIQIWRSLDTFKGHSDIKTWLYRIALNTSISLLRKNSNGKHVKVAFSEVKSSTLYHLSLHDSSGGDELRLLYQWIESLNTLDKTIMMLYLEDMSYKEIADITGMSEGNVGVKINRIKNNLKLKAKDHDGY